MITDESPTRFIPQNENDLSPELREVVKKIIQDESGVFNFNRLQFNPLHVEPAKPRHGLLVYADGTDWDPGSGEGIYRFDSSATWRFVG